MLKVEGIGISKKERYALRCFEVGGCHGHPPKELAKILEQPLTRNRSVIHDTIGLAMQ